MSIIINIKQNGFFKKKLDLTSLKLLTNRNNLKFGVSNYACVTDEYNGPNNINGYYFIVYSNSYGRGFEFSIDNKTDIVLRLNIPSTKSDIIDFYEFIKSSCELLKTTSFLQESEPKSIDIIPTLIEENITLSNDVLKNFCQKEDLTIFGAIYPVDIEDDFRKNILNATTDTIDIFEKYLYEKQSGDYYYAKPIIYNDKNTNDYIVMFALTKNVNSIIPINPTIPFEICLPENAIIKKWDISIGHYNDNYETLGIISFNDFKEKINLDSLPRYDKNHVIINLDDQLISKLCLKKDYY